MADYCGVSIGTLVLAIIGTAIAGHIITFQTDSKCYNNFEPELIDMSGGENYRMVLLALYIFDYICVIFFIIAIIVAIIVACIGEEDGFSAFVMALIAAACFSWGPHFVIHIWLLAIRDDCKAQKISGYMTTHYDINADPRRVVRKMKITNLTEFIEYNIPDIFYDGCPGNENRWLAFGLMIPWYIFFGVIPAIIDVIVIAIGFLSGKTRHY